MSQTTLNSLVVFLPGISGSSLCAADGTSVWDASYSAIWTGLKTFGKSLQRLQLQLPDPGAPIAPDGIRAVDLILAPHLFGGIVKIDGYDLILDAIRESFDSVIECLPGDEIAGNLLRFPYDWRRDNRISAHALKAAVDDKLRRWRDASRNQNAQVILVAHSMGGLISRYYLEVLGGASSCLALITLGTPYRGSLNALEYLTNGYKQANIDLTELMRSLPSMYQLLPIYESILAENSDRYISDCLDKGPLCGLDKSLVLDAKNFHEEIEAARNRNATSKITRYLVFPIVGIHQPTNQRAALVEAKLVVEKVERPKKIPAAYDGGDGTVPYAAAIPLEQSEAGTFRGLTVSDRHGSLQKNPFVIDNVISLLKTLQDQGLAEVCGTLEHRDGPKAISLDIDDYYYSLVSIGIRVRTTPTESVLSVSIEDVDRGQPIALEAGLPGIAAGADGWKDVHLGKLPAGFYRLRLSARSGSAPTARMTELFAVTS